MTEKMIFAALCATCVAACTAAPPPDTTAAQAPDNTPVSAPFVPDRFQGLFALDRRACEEDYTYQPAFQNVRVFANDVRFFENGGPVTDVDVDGPAAAVTLRDTYADGDVLRTLYLRDLGEERFRIRDGLSEQSRDYVRCGPTTRD
ncbi:hypothetical protein WJT74_00945 [Sphingomicrobium sp. XHP0239]|uniref:hypothetical protein n=1 Tax=Sphingomicrobium maritimum TaxID=3133972 RepID=UPI0031CC9B26